MHIYIYKNKRVKGETKMILKNRWETPRYNLKTPVTHRNGSVDMRTREFREERIVSGHMEIVRLAHGKGELVQKTETISGIKDSKKDQRFRRALAKIKLEKPVLPKSGDVWEKPFRGKKKR